MPRSWYLQRLRDVLRGADEPGGAGAAATDLPGCGVQVVVEHVAAGRQVEESLLSHGGLAMRILWRRTLILRHLRYLRLCLGPGLLGRVPDEGGDPQAELERRMRSAEFLAQ